MTFSYGDLLKDRRWQERRKEILARDNNCCVLCGLKTNLRVHHRQYHFIRHLGRMIEPWEYEDRYLITLCQGCHAAGHAQHDIPVKYLD
jgi:5-methylcytosine-specific restriction endonuclease McrA